MSPENPSCSSQKTCTAFGQAQWAKQVALISTDWQKYGMAQESAVQLQDDPYGKNFKAADTDRNRQQLNFSILSARHEESRAHPAINHLLSITWHVHTDNTQPFRTTEYSMQATHTKVKLPHTRLCPPAGTLALHSQNR